MKHFDIPKHDKFKTNPVAVKYKAKLDARHAALEKAKDGRSALAAKEGIHSSLKRK